MTTTLVFIIAGILIGVLLLRLRLPFSEALTTGIKLYLFAWLIYACVYCMIYVLKIILVVMLGIQNDWSSYFSSHKWIIQEVFYLLPIAIMLISSLSDNSTQNDGTKKRFNSKLRINPAIIPIPTSTRKKQVQTQLVRAISRKNLTNIKNNLSKGTSLTISLKEYCDADISELVSYAGQYRAKLTLTDCKLVSVKQLANMARNGRGFVTIDSIIEAGFDAQELAGVGVCFTCDCKNRSTIIKYIVEKSKKANGKLILINCQNLPSNEIAEIRSIGRDSVEIR